MEDKNVDGSVSAGASSCRWNPTKEQINMLEGLYRQGIRTPSAEQIQQITARLKVYGHIEGKNVFYWFQNHKARQRQKQKQENMIYLNRFLHHKPSPSVYAPLPCNSNVNICNPFYIPSHTSTVNGYYQQYPTKMPLPGAVLSRPRVVDYKVQVQENKCMSDSTGCEATVMNYRLDGMHTGDFNEGKNIMMINTPPTTTTTTSSNIIMDDHETLPLFPQHPTGVLEEKYSKTTASENYDYSHRSPLSSAENNKNSNDLSNNSSSDQSCIEEMSTTTTSNDHAFFDFFADDQDHYFER